MMLPSGKRFGQSEYELALAVFYSFFLHAAVVFVALLVHFSVFPKTVLPPAYQVKLVGAPQERAPAPPKKELVPAPEAPIPKKETMPVPAKPAPAPKKAAVELKKSAPKKDALPDLGPVKQKPAPVEQTKGKGTVHKEAPAVPSAPAAASPPAAAAPAVGQSEGVAVTSQQDFKYAWYLANVSAQIRQNWKPTLDSKEAKARVIFKVNRSGWVIDIQLDDEHSNGSFQFKQAALRAIRASNPFPPLPEEFYKQSLEFSVDLIPDK